MVTSIIIIIIYWLEGEPDWKQSALNNLKGNSFFPSKPRKRTKTNVRVVSD